MVIPITVAIIPTPIIAILIAQMISLSDAWLMGVWAILVKVVVMGMGIGMIKLIISSIWIDMWRYVKW